MARCLESSAGDLIKEIGTMGRRRQGVNGWKRFLLDSSPWSPRSIRWFWLAAILTVVMIALAYVLLWFGVQGKVPAWVGLAGQGVSIVLTVLAFWGAYRARRRDIEERGRRQS